MKKIAYAGAMLFFAKTQGRDAMIAAGTALGQIFLKDARPQPWIVTLGADAKSGKSLLALAIDQVFDPKFYPHGITPERIADILIYEKPRGKVAFLNAPDKTVYDQRALLDQRLHQLEKNFPVAKVIVYSNMRRNLTNDFNANTSGLRSDRLDMHIDVHIEDGEFTRRMDIIVENPSLCRALSKNPLFQR